MEGYGYIGDLSAGEKNKLAESQPEDKAAASQQEA